MRTFIQSAALLGLLLPSIDATAEEASVDSTAAIEFFETSVRPLLAEHCWECHGAKTQWNNLRLDSNEAIRRGGDSGPVVGSGDAAESLLFKAVSRSGDLEMPPDDPLSDQQIATLRKWIELGAPWPTEQPKSTPTAWKEHWAFQPLRSGDPPTTDGGQWCRNPVDQFVLQRLVSEGMQPSTEADRATLIRRVTYSLTGLPPTATEIDAFVNDPRPDAYETLVDRLLDSRRYGEHLARMWLDVARYSDTKGYVYAREERFFVNSALYRDWVIQAFNNDLPYDQFIKLQLAADQCDAQNPGSLAAMGFLTLGRRFLGVTHDIIDDRIDVVGRGTMGLTLSCARCHDHKYDPIPTADYYSLYGVFQCSTDRQVDLTEYAETQPSPEFVAELNKRQSALADKLAQSRLEAGNRVRSRIADYLFAQSELDKYGQEGFDVVLATSDIIPAFVRRWERYLLRCDADHDPIFSPWLQLVALAPDQFDLQAPTVIEQCRNNPQLHPWIRDLLDEPVTSLRQIADRYGALFSKIDRRFMEVNEREGDPSAKDQEWLATAKPLIEVLYGPTAPCEVPDEEIIATETYFDSGTCTALWKLQGEVDRWRLQAAEAPPVAVAVFDRATLVDANIFRRGNPANKGPREPRHFLTMFADETPEPFQSGSGRLELAERIVDPANPLTPRVWVNRLWQHHFGEGLVRTPSDFGLRASPPTHPELLDWLATQLLQSNWSTKQIQRLMVLSATFRQASTIDGNPKFQAYRERDPGNRLLWRMNSRRLRFEEMRDSLLSVSGDLQQQLGGKPMDLFTGKDSNHRRTVYGLVDRQYLPATLRVFDFANPDLHVGHRSETLVPQQSLFFLNHPFMAARAESVIARLHVEDAIDNVDDSELREQVTDLYKAVLNRLPESDEATAAVTFLKASDSVSTPAPSAATQAWSYGFGEVDDAANRLKSFQPLPHFTGSAWQGGPAWPDGKLGWVQLTAIGGHPGNDPQHACVRRWTAPAAMRIAITSTAKHEPDIADGVRFRIVSSRHGKLAETTLKASEAALDVPELDVEAGDTIDFVVDIISVLNSDQHLWAPVIRQVSNSNGEQETSGAELSDWNATRDFIGPSTPNLSKWEQLAQILMLTNEFWFVD
ncbi:MAG: PSD1 and planctomycete cytochrome C domain-containing protein [Pirellulaceae bacterium]